jgi:hypothetical protein
MAVNFYSGQKLRASQLRLAILGGTLIAYHHRDSNSTGSTTTAMVPALRISGIQVYAGRNYKVMTSPLRLDTGTANDVGSALITFTNDGTDAGAASSMLPGGQAEAILSNVAAGEDVLIATRYTPSFDHLLSLCLGPTRVSGSGSIVIQADGSTTLCELMVYDAGDDVGDTGVNL